MKQFLFATLALLLADPAFATEPAKQQAAIKPFTHPGLFHNSDELEALRQKIEINKNPFARNWRMLRFSGAASLKYQPNAYPEVVRGPYNQPDIGGSEFSSDSAAAYTHALVWSLTGKKEHAEKAIEILNDWSSTLKEVSGHDTKLLIGMMGVRFCNAAELIKHSGADWPKEDQQQFERMLREVFYAEIKDFYPSANGNWDASMIQTMVAMGIYLDDREMFDRAVKQYRHGQGNGAIGNYFNEFGECQESGRDQAHTQMGLGFLSSACEMAWKQGVDLYGELDNRLALGYEYTARYNLGLNVRYEPFRSVDGRYFYEEISDNSRGRFSPIYHRVVNHYKGRMGLDVPHCVDATNRLDSSDGRKRRRRSSAHMPWDALVFTQVESKDEEGEAEESDKGINKTRELIGQ